MPPTHNTRFPGIILIVFGICVLVANILDLSWEHFWPIFMIVGGLWFLVLFLRDRRNFGLLMPASIFLTIGSLFLFHSSFGWNSSNITWPIYIAAPGIGFFAMYYFGKKDVGFLFPAFMLTGLALLFFLINLNKGEYWPVILILIGLVLIYSKR